MSTANKYCVLVLISSCQSFSCTWIGAVVIFTSASVFVENMGTVFVPWSLSTSVKKI